MENHITIPIFKLNDADVGTVVFVVEGIDREYEVVERIFSLLGYAREGTKKKFPAFLELRSKNKPFNRIVIVRAESNNIKSVEDFNAYFDKTYSDFFIEQDIETRYSPVYYIWDRDPGNNPEERTMNAFNIMNTPRNEENNMNGLILLSYPCVEAYLVTCNENLDFLPDDVKPKKYVGEHKFLPRRLGEKEILCGATTMFATLAEIGVSDDIFFLEKYDDFNRRIFKKEEAIRKNNAGKYRLLSLLSVALIDLGILEIDDRA